MFNLVALAAIAAVTTPHLASTLPPPTGIPVEFFQRGGHYGNYVSLVISSGGQVIDCRISETKGAISNDDKVCPYIRSQIFSPARQANRAPILSKVDQLFFWPEDGAFKIRDSDINLDVVHLPEGSALHPSVEVALDVDAQGKIADCDVARSSGIQSLDAIACERASTAGLVGPIKDEKNKKVESYQFLTVGFGTYAKPNFKKVSSYAALGDAGPYYPERAIRLNVRGYVILECNADKSGQVSDCVIDEEAPLGFAFGNAVKKMARDKWMKMLPGTEGKILIRIDFPQAGNFRLPSTPFFLPK